MVYKTVTLMVVLDKPLSTLNSFEGAIKKVKMLVINEIRKILCHTNSCKISGTLTVFRNCLESIILPNTEVNLHTKLDDWYDNTFKGNCDLNQVEKIKHLKDLTMKIIGNFNDIDFYGGSIWKTINTRDWI